MLDKLVKRLKEMNEKEGSGYHFIKWFSQIGEKDKQIVGLKAYYQAYLYHKHYLVPNGFVILPSAFEYTLKQNNILSSLLDSLRKLKEMPSEERENYIEDTANRIQKAIVYSYIPNSVQNEIRSNFKILNLKKTVDASSLLDENKENRFGAVRISQDLSIVRPFHLSFLNVKIDEINDAIKTIWAAMFLSDNLRKFIDEYDKLLNVPIIVQEMVYAKRSGRAVVDGINAKIIANRGFGVVFNEDYDFDEYTVNLKNYTFEVKAKTKECYYTIGDNDKVTKVEKSSDDQVYNDHEIRDIAYMIKRVCLETKKDGIIDFSSDEDKIFILQYNEGLGDFTEDMFKEEVTEEVIEELPIDENAPAPQNEKSNELNSTVPEGTQTTSFGTAASSQTNSSYIKQEDQNANLNRLESNQTGVSQTEGSESPKNTTPSTSNPLFDFLSGRTSSIEEAHKQEMMHNPRLRDQLTQQNDSNQIQHVENQQLSKQVNSEPYVQNMNNSSLNHNANVDISQANKVTNENHEKPSLISGILKQKENSEQLEQPNVLADSTTSSSSNNVSVSSNNTLHQNHEDEVVVEDMDKEYLYKLYDEYLSTKEGNHENSESSNDAEIKLKKILLKMYSKYQNSVNLQDIKPVIENVNQVKTKDIVSAIEKIIDRV